MKKLKEYLADYIDGVDLEMAGRLKKTMRKGDLHVRGNEALSCALAALRQLGFSQTALAIESYLVGKELKE